MQLDQSMHASLFVLYTHNVQCSTNNYYSADITIGIDSTN